MFVEKGFYDVIDLNIKCHYVNNNDNHSNASHSDNNCNNHHDNIPIVVHFDNFDTDLPTYHNLRNSAYNHRSGVSLSRVGQRHLVRPGHN
jgi:superfamily I DNA and/or RNA helicase